MVGGAYEGRLSELIDIIDGLTVQLEQSDPERESTDSSELLRRLEEALEEYRVLKKTG